jgi:hypothetical protein
MDPFLIFMSILICLSLIGFLIALIANELEDKSRNYKATDISREHLYVDEIALDMAKNPDDWTMDEYRMTNGKIQLWIGNEPYADMNITYPTKFNFSWAGAKALRAAKDVLASRKLQKAIFCNHKSSKKK